MRTTRKHSSDGVRTWIEIDRRAMAKNYALFRKAIPSQTKLCAVVKSNAYGHELVGSAREMQKLGADFIAVDSMSEALAVRKGRIGAPMLVLGHTLKGLFAASAREHISITISNIDGLKNAIKFSKRRKIRIHLKVDTGMHRQGFTLKQMDEVMKLLNGVPKNMIIEGVYTHFAAAKNPAFPKDTHEQIREFEQWRERLANDGYTPIFHASATSGTLLFPEAHYDMVRVGIGMYGHWPSKEVQNYCRGKIALAPALTWKTLIGEVKELAKGERIGYDLTEEMKHRTKVAILPVGYWHGYPRALSGVGNVLVRGKRAKVLGRVSMDMIAVDVSKVTGVRAGDEVILIGKSGREEVSADELGELAETINYEIITRLNPLIRRIFI